MRDCQQLAKGAELDVLIQQKLGGGWAMSSEAMDRPRAVVIVDEVCDVEETGQALGKHWGQQRIQLTEEHLSALRQGQLLAQDVNEEYVVFLE